MEDKMVYKDYLQYNKDIWNEFSKENIIYDESQSGPQEEPYLQEIYLDLEQFRKYRNRKRKMKKAKK